MSARKPGAGDSPDGFRDPSGTHAEKYFTDEGIRRIVAFATRTQVSPLDYKKAIERAAELGHPQGTHGCIMFVRGAEWFRDTAVVASVVDEAATPSGSTPEEVFEIRANGERVRKGRWEYGIRRIVALLWGNRHEFEIDEVVEAVAKLVPAPFNDGNDEGLVRCVLGK